MRNLTAVYTYEYNLMKKQIKAQAILITVLIITALISCFYNMKLTIDNGSIEQEKQALEELTEMQNSMISDLEANCKDLFIQIEELKEGYVYGKDL